MATTNPKQTSAKAAKAASTVLMGSSPAAKSAAGSALAQARPHSAKKK